MRLRVDETDCPAESNVLPETGASIASMSSRIVASRTHAFTPADLLTLSRNGILVLPDACIFLQLLTWLFCRHIVLKFV